MCTTSQYPDTQATTGNRFADLLRPDDVRSVQRLASKLCRSPQDADDAVQQTMLVAMRDIGKLRDPRAVRPWLRSVARNCCHAIYRRRARRVAQSIDALADDMGLPVADMVVARDSGSELPTADLSTLRERLDRAIATLRDNQRKVFVMRFVDGHSAHDIHRMLRMPLSTVKLRLQQARQRLAALLAPFAAQLGVAAEA